MESAANSSDADTARFKRIEGTMTLILGIDTSGLTGSVALARDGEVLERRTLEPSARRHAQALVADIAALFQICRLKPTDLSAVGVVRGPGSFTGLRVGVVCAKTVSYALKIPVISLDAFDVVAAQCPDDLASVWIVDDAQRGELFVGRYRRTDGDCWRREGERFLRPAREWLSSLPVDDVVLGPGVAKIPEEIAAPRILREESLCRPFAETVCRMTEQKLLAGDIDDCWALVPFYVRASAAEEKAGLAP